MPAYRTKTVSYNGATLTVRERVGRDVWTEQIVSAKLPASEPPYLRTKFGEFVTRTEKIEGNLGFAWPDLNASEAETQAAFRAWCDLKPALMIVWGNALYDANQDAGDADLAPKLPGES